MYLFVDIYETLAKTYSVPGHNRSFIDSVSDYKAIKLEMNIVCLKTKKYSVFGIRRNKNGKLKTLEKLVKKESTTEAFIAKSDNRNHAR